MSFLDLENLQSSPLTVFLFLILSHIQNLMIRLNFSKKNKKNAIHVLADALTYRYLSEKRRSPVPELSLTPAHRAG